MDLTYDTLGREARALLVSVVMVRTVVIPRAMRAEKDEMKISKYMQSIHVRWLASFVS